jgi:sugar phosphate isomerase/epimerase
MVEQRCSFTAGLAGDGEVAMLRRTPTLLVGDGLRLPCALMKILPLVLLLTATSALAGPVADHLGLQMYSLRVMLKEQGLPAALDQTKAFGLAAIEGSASTENSTVEQTKAAIEQRGMTLVAAGVGYEQLEKDLVGAVAQAKSAGVQYVSVTWIPHHGDEFTEAEATKAASDFNRWGAAFKKAGISFVYHPHGYEFRPRADGTNLFDLIVHQTEPADVNFELDVFWATHGGQDPVKLMTKYPTRWRTMHVKDIRKGAPTGIYTGHAPSSDDVPVGSGQVDWPAVLKKANEVGVQWYFIEDESDTPLKNIPQSIAYIRSLGL